ncbi:MAG: hypothetical protein DYH12_15715 [Sorangiineae bacterium PRO1]|nr:hypothetical protein [Sorangiineae bacterium PRO1]
MGKQVVDIVATASTSEMTASVFVGFGGGPRGAPKLPAGGGTKPAGPPGGGPPGGTPGGTPGGAPGGE